MRSKKSIAFLILVFLLIQAPIYYYMIFYVLQSINAKELVWFLYWIYVPVGILTGVLSKIIDIED